MNKYRVKSEEWKQMIDDENIINRYNNGESLKVLQLELIDKYKLNIQDKYSGRALSKAIERCGYDKFNNNYVKSDIMYGDNFVSEIIERDIDYITRRRYYKCHVLGFNATYEPESVSLDTNIVSELNHISNKLGVTTEKYITHILLSFLEKADVRDLSKEFRTKLINESGYWSEEEKQFIFSKEKEGYDIVKVSDMFVLCKIDLGITEKDFDEEYKNFKLN